MRFYALSWFIAGFVVAGVGVSIIDFAHASDHVRRAPKGYVVAESVVNGQHVTGAVRETALGPQVQLPGGSWIYCRRSCSETLRVETVDFWQARVPGGGAGEAGLFGLKFQRSW